MQMRYRRTLPVVIALASLLLAVGCGEEGSGGSGGSGDNEPADVGDVEPDGASPDVIDDVDPGLDSGDIGEDVVEPDADAGDSDGGEEEDTWGQRDPDSDGLTNAQEADLCGGDGSDPYDSDTDDDNLSDYEEWNAGTNPCKADTDGDGATDYEEVSEWPDLNPQDPITYDDGKLDGDRWILEACDQIAPAEFSEFTNSDGNWRLALPTGFSNYRNLPISGMGAPIAAAVYDNPTIEVAGFMISRQVTGSTPARPEDALQGDIVSRMSNEVSVDDVSNGPGFETHGGFRAAQGNYTISPSGSSEASIREIREQILPALGPFSGSDLSNLPNPAGSTHASFRVSVTVIRRPAQTGSDNQLVAVSISPLEAFTNDNKVEYRMNDLTNPTNIAEEADSILGKCQRETADKEQPVTEFYWVLDQSGSMTDEINTVISFSSDFADQVGNTSLDYRFGVTNMDPVNDGRLQVPPAWHDQASTLQSEVSDRAHPDLCDTSGGWGCSGGAEHGLENAQNGLEYMRGLGSHSPTTPEEIRADAQVITIVMTDDNANTVESDPSLQGMYENFFNGRTTMFSIVDPGDGNGNLQCSGAADVGEAYQGVSTVTGGTTSSICGNLESTISDIIETAAGKGSDYVLSPRPITPSLKVFINGNYVPRNSSNGYKYFAESSSIAFFGSFRPDPDKADDPTVAPDRLAVSFKTFKDECKKEEQGAFNCRQQP